MENLIEKMKAEIDNLTEKNNSNLSKKEKSMLTGKLEATKDCLQWTELAQIENKCSRKEQEHKAYKKGWNDALIFAYTEIVDKINDSIREINATTRDI